MKTYDISPLVSESLAVWPGDRPFSRHVLASLEKGDNIDLSSISTTVHIGAHADARSHYVKGAPSIEQSPLSPYFGVCQVLEVSVEQGGRIGSEWADQVRSPRVLFKTNSYLNPETFNDDFVSLSPELIYRLRDQGCVLVGIDTPSVDPFADKVLESHHALSETGILNLEGLILNATPPGFYFLSALPLKIKDADASPVRAVLFSILDIKKETEKW